ncbi:MAG TPA: hypothetical protein VMU24_13860 [Candidatus Acidoferrales bacterium]|nr:hypothetical protein [Candidatus Acidoferrales bacterium]
MKERLLLVFVAFFVLTAFAQTPAPDAPPQDISGMYTFLHEGEFVQLTLNGSVLSGFISRFADDKQDRFVDQFFNKASWNNGELAFDTRKADGVWYDFKGTAKQTPGKTAQQEGFIVLAGTLTQHSPGADGKDVAEPRQVEFQSFAADEVPPK